MTSPGRDHLSRVSEAPDVKASEIQKINGMVNLTTLMCKALDITESQISHLKIGENNVLFSASKSGDNGCEGTLKTLTHEDSYSFIRKSA